MQKKILIADDDRVNREMLNRFLRSGSDRFEILNASDEYQALNQLSLKKIDLLIIDLQISHDDDYSFLTLIRNEYPYLLIFVITAFGTPEIQHKIEGIGKCRFFEKPLDMAVITNAVSQALAPHRFEGRITGLRFASFLQLIKEEQKTCHLLVRSNNRTGEVGLSNGSIISARSNNLENMAALNEINTWDDITIEILENDTSRKKGRNKQEENPGQVEIAAPENISKTIDSAETPPSRDIYSEHYSLTKEYIAQIEKIQLSCDEEHDYQDAPDEQDYMDEQDEPDEQEQQDQNRIVAQAKPSAGTIDPLVRMLKNNSQIETYGIYDNHDILHSTRSESTLFEQCRPSDFYKPALSVLTQINGGSFLCMMIKQINIHHILFRYRKKWFWIIVNPDFQVTGLLEMPLQGVAVHAKKQEPEPGIRHNVRDEKMEKLLEELNQTKGIMGSYVLSLKKRVIANRMPPVFTSAKLLTIGKLVAKIYLAGKMSIKDISEITLFYQESVITIREISEQIYLVVLYDPSMMINHLFTSVNMIMADLKQLAGKYTEIDSVPVEAMPPAMPKPERKPSTDMDDILKNNAVEEREAHIIDPDTLISSGPMAGVLQEMQTALTKVIGPIAPILFTAALKEWIATDRPDFATIQGLVDILRKEINDPERFETYRTKITPYIWVNN